MTSISVYQTQRRIFFYFIYFRAGTPTITVEGSGLDMDSISVVSSIAPSHMYQCKCPNINRWSSSPVSSTSSFVLFFFFSFFFIFILFSTGGFLCFSSSVCFFDFLSFSVYYFYYYYSANCVSFYFRLFIRLCFTIECLLLVGPSKSIVACRLRSFLECER